MNDNEATNASSSNKRSSEHLVTECEENCRVFDEDHVNEPDDRGGFGSGAHVGADLIVPVSEVEEYKGEHKRSAEYWPIPDTDGLVKICALPEGLGELEPGNSTPAYAVARALQNLWILLERMKGPKSEPVTLKAVDIPSAA